MQRMSEIAMVLGDTPRRPRLRALRGIRHKGRKGLSTDHWNKHHKAHRKVASGIDDEVLENKVG